MTRRSTRFTTRLVPLAAGLAGAALVASSCSLDAAVTTDRSGRIVAVDSIRIQSTVQDMALAMLVRGTALVLEFRWDDALAQRVLFMRPR